MLSGATHCMVLLYMHNTAPVSCGVFQIALRLPATEPHSSSWQYPASDGMGNCNCIGLVIAEVIAIRMGHTRHC